MRTATWLSISSTVLIVLAVHAGGGTGRPCGPAYPDCLPGQYCKAENGTCGVVSSPGECHVIPTDCDNTVAEVCGCDYQMTYLNECHAEAAEAWIFIDAPCDALCNLELCEPGEFCHDPSCGTTPPPNSAVCMTPPTSCLGVNEPVCGCDGVTYASACHAHLEQVSVDFGFSCDTEFCVPSIGLFCTAQDDFCDIWGCAVDIGGICVPERASCPSACVPVCGCNGQVYPSDCHRQLEFVALAQEGDCDEVLDAIFDTRDQLRWDTAFNTTGYNVYREVVEGGSAAGAWDCFLPGVGDNSAPIAGTPASGELWLLQVAAVFDSGEGSLGFETAGCTNRMPAGACPP